MRHGVIVNILTRICKVDTIEEMVVNIALAFFFAWMSVLTYIVVTAKKHYERLSKRTGSHSIDTVLDTLIHEGEKNKFQIDSIKKKIAEMEATSHHMYDRIGVVQFHALGKTEGERSFVVALLNTLRSGIVLNFMYIPDGIRVFAKQIKDGKGVGHELSQEEIEAIQKAA